MRSQSAHHVQTVNLNFQNIYFTWLLHGQTKNPKWNTTEIDVKDFTLDKKMFLIKFMHYE